MDRETLIVLCHAESLHNALRRRGLASGNATDCANGLRIDLWDYAVEEEGVSVCVCACV